MNRLTTDKPVKEMSMTELALNCCYGKDGWVWYRDYEDDIDIRDLARRLWQGRKTHDELPEDDEALGEFLLDWTAYDPAFFDEALIALTYRLMWAMAELRAHLAAYEDTGLTPEECAGFARFKADFDEPGNGLGISRIIEILCADAEGRLIVLPCKVGDTVYLILNDKRVVKGTADRFALREKLTVDVRYNNFGLMETTRYWGETVFLTREEAEAALGRADDAE